MTASQRTAEKTFYATKRREELVRLLAPDLRCAICGRVRAVAQLDIDHIDGRDWRVEDVSPSMRVARYWREHAAGVRMRVLCHTCGGRDGGGRRYAAPRRASSRRIGPRRR